MDTSCVRGAVLSWCLLLTSEQETFPYETTVEPQDILLLSRFRSTSYVVRRRTAADWNLFSSNQQSIKQEPEVTFNK